MQEALSIDWLQLFFFVFLGLGFLLYNIYDNRKTNKEWMKKYGKPYSKRLVDTFVIFFLLFILTPLAVIGSFHFVTEPIKVETIKTYQRTGGSWFYIDTSYYALVNGKYHVALSSPYDLQKGDTVVLKRALITDVYTIVRKHKNIGD